MNKINIIRTAIEVIVIAVLTAKIYKQDKQLTMSIKNTDESIRQTGQCIQIVDAALDKLEETREELNRIYEDIDNHEVSEEV